MDEFPELTASSGTSVFPPPTLDEPTISVIPQETPKKRRAGLFVGAGVLAIAAIAAAGVVLLKNDTANATYSLSKASATAAETKAVAFTMTMGVMGHEVSANAETDSSSGLTHMVMDMSSLDDSLKNLEMVVDSNGKAIYFNSAFLAQTGVAVGTDWVKLDTEFLQQMAGGGQFSIFDSANLGNPLDAAALFDSAKSVTEVGFDEVDGVKVKHFQVVVDTAQAIKVSPQLQQQLSDLGADIPTEVTYDAYVDEQNQIRRITIETSVAGQQISVDVVIKPLTEPIVIAVPDPSEVTDLAGLL